MAYLLKAKQNIEQQDVAEFKVKKEKYLQRRKQKRELKDTAQAFEPGGVFGGQIAPPILQKHKEESAFIRYAEFAGTFSVLGTDHSVRVELVRKRLNLMKVIVRSRPVLVIVSAKGVKVTDKRGQALLMAHATHRISYCTCLPEERLFCFLTREPKCSLAIHYCHVFTAPKPAQVEELNTILGNAFKTAHSAQKSAITTFNDKIAEELEHQRELYAEVQERNNKEQTQNKKLERMKKLTESNGQRKVSTDEKYKVDLEKYSWYRPNMSREEALDYLLKREIGSFVVRPSTSHQGDYALSVRVHLNDNAPGISHYLLVNSSEGVQFKGLDKEWSNLAALIVHHSIMPELLPCTLSLPDTPVEDQK